MFERRSNTRTWGFQFFATDAAAIAAFASLAMIFWHFGSPLSWILLTTATHFFLFCNVFRIVRRRELIWAATFIINIGLWTWLNKLSIAPVLLCQLPITTLLILMDVRSSTYHGIFASRLNPVLNDYLKAADNQYQPPNNEGLR